MPQAKRAKRRPKKVKRVLNVDPSRDTERDWQLQQATPPASCARPPQPCPKSKDLRETWWKVGDQGSTGSCVGWATADALLRWHFVKSGRIKRPRRCPSASSGWRRRRPTSSTARRRRSSRIAAPA